MSIAHPNHLRLCPLDKANVLIIILLASVAICMTITVLPVTSRVLSADSAPSVSLHACAPSLLPLSCMVFKGPDYHRPICRPPPGVIFPPKVQHHAHSMCAF